MGKVEERDEYIEQMWYMKEEGKESVQAFKESFKEEFDQSIMDSLVTDGFIHVSPDASTVRLTDAGHSHARRLIRAHRLAERLLHDVLGGEFENPACEFEHTVSFELIDSICTLLGHPRECPHGHPIPEGECCKRFQKTAVCFIEPLTDIKPGQSGRIAYINCKNDQLLHKLEGMCIRPGVCVKLHQTYPAYVLECEGASIALDREVASSICVWKDPGLCMPGTDKPVHETKDDYQGIKGFFAKIFGKRAEK